MHGKAQPDGRPAFQIIETPFLLCATCGLKYTCNATFRLTSCCSGKITAIISCGLRFRKSPRLSNNSMYKLTQAVRCEYETIGLRDCNSAYIREV